MLYGIHTEIHTKRVHMKIHVKIHTLRIHMKRLTAKLLFNFNSLASVHRACQRRFGGQTLSKSLIHFSISSLLTLVKTSLKCMFDKPCSPRYRINLPFGWSAFVHHRVYVGRLLPPNIERRNCFGVFFPFEFADVLSVYIWTSNERSFKQQMQIRDLRITWIVTKLWFNMKILHWRIPWPSWQHTEFLSTNF